MDACIEKTVDQTQKMFKTLIRIERVVQGVSGKFIFFKVPGWNHQAIFIRPLDVLPEDIRSLVKPIYRLHAYANIGAEHKKDIHFEDWGCD